MSLQPRDKRISLSLQANNPTRNRWFVPAVCFSLILIIPPMPAAQAPNDVGMPFIRNFTPDDYGQHPQNWAVAEDPRGVIYFGNGGGILEFDGKNWSVFPNANNSLIRSLEVDKKGTVYYGGSGDIGYLGVDPRGKLQIVSLLEKLKPQDRTFNDVWKTFSSPDGVYFLTNEKVFRYHDDRIDVIPVQLAAQFGFKIEDTVFVIIRGQGLAVLKENSVLSLPQTGEIDSAKLGRIHGMPYIGRKILLGSSGRKFFTYDLEGFYDAATGKYDFTRKPGVLSLPTPFPCEAAEYLDDRKTLYNIMKINDDRYALTTLNAGLLIIDRGGRIVQTIDKKRGLIDDIPRDVLIDRRGNLWLPCNNGISYVEFNSPVSQFNGSLTNLPSYVLAAIRHESRLYVGTFSGVHVLAGDASSLKGNVPSFVQVENCTSECAAFEVINGMLLAATNGGAFLIRGQSGVRVCDQGGIYCLGKSKKFPHHIFLGLIDGLALLEYVPSGNTWQQIPKFIYHGKLKDIPETIRAISEDADGNLWVSTQFNGIAQLKFAGSEPSQFKVTRYLQEQGLPQSEGNYAFYFQNRLLVASAKGIYEGVAPAGNASDPPALRFAPERTFGRFLSDPPIRTTNFLSDRSGNILVNTDKGIFCFSKAADGDFQITRDPFRKIPATNVNIHLDERGTVWVPQAKGLFRYDPAVKKKCDIPYSALIRKVTVGKNMVAFHGAYHHPDFRRGDLCGAASLTQPPDMIPVLPYKNNSLAFEYSAAFYEPTPGIQFRHILEKFEKSWTDWSNDSRTEYTNLPEGSYTFRVKARNIYEYESEEAVYRFTIKPPWHRTILAYLAFLAFGAMGFIAALKLYTIRLRRDKARLETLVDLRTQEIKEASLTDPLTGLRNRRYMSEILREDILAFLSHKKYLAESKDRRTAIREGNIVYGVFLFDIDRFKAVNDAYGHEMGDRLLKQFAQLLKSSVRGDDAVMRIGGEEFLVVLKKTQYDYLDVFAAKLMTKVQEAHFEISPSISLKKTCSIGYTAFPIYSAQPNLVDFEHTVMISDLALYYAKNNGRNLAIHILPSDNPPKTEEEVRQMATSLEIALNNDHLKIKA